MFRSIRQILFASYRDGAEKHCPSSHNRSVNDFSTADELRHALCSSQAMGSCKGGDEAAWLFSKNESILQDLLQTEGNNTENDECLSGDIQNSGMDWVLDNFDISTSEKQTFDHELRRLLILKSFLILDTSHKESFDDITTLAQTFFQTAYCMISLVDLGRQWFLSKQGLEANETPRNISFCTHGIQSTLDVFEVPDATQDDRFKNNPLVTGPPNVQYYAGVPLQSPEGYKLGMLCVCDTSPRKPLSLEERETLKRMANMTVDTLVEHRRKMRSWYSNLVSTHYPDLVDLDVAKSSNHFEANYYPNEDEEFANFIQATENLSLDKLVDMLEKEVEDDKLQQQQQQQQQQKRPPLITADSASRPRKRQIKKQFRFAEMVQVNYVDSLKEFKDELWYDADEMMDIRFEKNVDAVHYRNSRPYMKAIQKVIKVPEQRIKDHLPELIEAHVPSARGLESSIVDSLRTSRKKTRKAVIEQQHYLERKGYFSFEELMKKLRDQSLRHSLMATKFSANLGQVDHIDALYSATPNHHIPTAA